MDNTSNFRISIFLAALIMVIGFTLAPASNINAETVEKERIIENNLIATEEGTYSLDEENAMNEGLSKEDAEVAAQFSDELLNDRNISEGEIQPMVAPPILLLLPAIGKGAATVVKAAIAGGAAAVGVAFATDVYNTTTYTACQNHYGKVDVIDNFCEANGHVD